MNPPDELELPSAVASLELGNDFGSDGISPLDIVENSPFEDISALALISILVDMYVIFLFI